MKKLASKNLPAGSLEDSVGEERARDNRPRVLAYSDSDSDVETHVQNVKEHILPHIEKLKAPAGDGTGNTGDADKGMEADMAEEDGNDGNSAKPKARGKDASTREEKSYSVLTPMLHVVSPLVLLKALGLLYVRSINERVGNVADAVAAAAGISGVVMQRYVHRNRTENRNRRLEIFHHQCTELGIAAALVTLSRATRHLRRRGAKKLFRLMSPVNIDALAVEDNERPHPDRPPESAAEWAIVYGPEMKEMRRILLECKVDLPTERFDESNAELFRFAAACGLQKAETPEERASAIESAVRRIILTCEWMANTPQMSDIKLHKWERLVAWRGKDAVGCPILLIRLGRALQLCTKDGRLKCFTSAILSQVLKGVVEGNNLIPGGPDKFIAVVDCRETSNWSVLLRSREVYRLVKSLVDDLVAYFPEHLKTVHLLELPIVARMQLQSITKSLPEVTRGKVIHALSSDESLPITVANLQKRRSFAAGLSRRSRDGSEVSFATTEGSTPRQDASLENEVEDNEQASENLGETPIEREENLGEIELQLPTANGTFRDELIGSKSLESDRDMSSPEEVFHSVVKGAKLDACESDVRDSTSGSDIARNREEVTTNLLNALGQATDSTCLGSSPHAQRKSDNDTINLEKRGSDDQHADANTPLIEKASEININSKKGQQYPSSYRLETIESPVLSEQDSFVSLCDHEMEGSSPWVGLSSFVSNLVPSIGRPTGYSKDLVPQERKSFGSSQKLNSGNQSGAKSEYSRVPYSIFQNSLLKPIKGGIRPLPIRSRAIARQHRTPGKSSLRRSRSDELPPSSGTISSHPLYRQTSVSWADDLEKIREIESPPRYLWRSISTGNLNRENYRISKSNRNNSTSVQEFYFRATATYMLLNLAKKLLLSYFAQ